MTVQLGNLTTEEAALIWAAIDQITIPMLEALDYGEEVELVEGVVLYHYTEDDIYVVNLTSDWTEVLQVLWNEESKEIEYEEL